MPPGQLHVRRPRRRPREDVALVLLECLQAPNTVGIEFELFERGVPARKAAPSL